MLHIAANCVPQILMADHMQQLASKDETLSRVITGNESWFYGYDLETK